MRAFQINVARVLGSSFLVLRPFSGPKSSGPQLDKDEAPRTHQHKEPRTKNADTRKRKRL